jgi:O-antigen chain-terminating methyltransferase
MLETQNPEIDVSYLQKKIEAEIALQRQRREEMRKSGPPEKLTINDPYSWAQLSETLKMAELNVNAGAEVTSMLHYRGIVRKFARLLGKITIYLGRVITIPQRHFNSSLLHCLRITLDGIRDMNRNTAVLEGQVRRIEGLLHEKSAIIDYLKTGLVTQERRVAILLEELQSQVDSGGKRQVSPTVKVPDILDPLYLAFEEQFRGSREEIRARLLEYVPLVRRSGAGMEGREILDIGCGRGEWLQIMQDEGLAAKGLDLNHVLVRECRDKGFAVEEIDALSYLRSLPDNSIGAITSFHLIEHLSFADRIALFDESVRVLKSGGLALFETPNPRNLLVGGCNFWADPTHLRPLYPETHKFLLEYRGFSNVELLFLHPHEGDQRLPEEEAPKLALRLNEILSCARDYTIVGYKA